MLLQFYTDSLTYTFVFVLWIAPWFQSNFPHKCYIQLCMNKLPQTLFSHLFPTTVPPVSCYPAKSDLEEITMRYNNWT